MDKKTSDHVFLNLDEAESYVAKHSAAGKDVFWDSWDVVIFKPDANAIRVKNGMYRNGQWGKTRRVKVSDRGVWRLPVRP